MNKIADKHVLLLVDDDPENIEIVNSILGEEHEIRVAKNGVKALELANMEPSPGLILLDVIMPHMDGYEVCKHLKADPKTRDIPVIFLTGKTDVVNEMRGFDVGAVDYIHKPFSPPIVKARVRTHLMLRVAHETLTQQLATMNREVEMARQVQLSILPMFKGCCKEFPLLRRDDVGNDNDDTRMERLFAVQIKKVGPIVGDEGVLLLADGELRDLPCDSLNGRR